MTKRMLDNTITEGSATIVNFHKALEWLDDVCPMTGYWSDDEIYRRESELKNDIIDGVYSDCLDDGPRTIEIKGADGNPRLLEFQLGYTETVDDDGDVDASVTITFE